MSGRGPDVVVVGGGNAAFSAAHAAAERGRRVLVLEKADRDHAGGNSFYTAGAIRIAHDGIESIADLLDPDDRHAVTDLPPYPEDDFGADVVAVTDGRNDPVLTAALVQDSQATVRWLHGKGLRFRLMYERQAYLTDGGRYQFWGGLALGSTGGGRGLMAQHTAAAASAGIEVRYGCRAHGLVLEDGAVRGVRYTDPDGHEHTVTAESVVLGAGGFEADAELRRTHLGEGWQRAKVRGTPLNTGDMLSAALEIGAAPYGDWGTCHSVAWDAWHPRNESNRELTNQLTRGGYPLGIMVNQRGERFLDEGADFRNLTYAKYGAEILQQPDGVAFQIYDASIRPLLRVEEYDMPDVSVVRADTVRDLAQGLGIDPDILTATVETFNAAIDREVPFVPSVRDGRRARTQPAKSHWANPIETPPFWAYPVTCAITFTFGGLHADQRAQVLDEHGTPIPGLFVCGEMVGGLFSGNYPGGSGLTSGAVFGRRAGSNA